MKKNNYDVFSVILMSAIIGIIVGFIDVLVEHWKVEMALVLLRDCAIGVLIGFVCRFLFIRLYMDKKINPGLAFLLMGSAIALISSMPFYLYYIVDKEPISWVKMASMVSVAEVLGLGFIYSIYRQMDNLNRRLDMKKKEFNS